MPKLSVPDGRVWCEACNLWLNNVAAWLEHRKVCPKHVGAAAGTGRA